MRFALLVPLAFTAPILAATAGTLGFALGTKLADGTCKSTSDYEKDFDAISKASVSKLVRGYSASDCNCASAILPAAKSRGFQVVLGIWPDVDSSYNADVAAIKAALPGNQNTVYAITCGSEVLYRKSLTPTALLSRINDVKKQFPGIKVGIADSWNKFADGSADQLIQGGVKLFMANAFAYWQGQQIGNATKTYFDDIMQAFQHIQTRAGGPNKVELWCGETGWPTDGGTDYGLAKASTASASTFFQQGVCGMLNWGVNVFYFEAFDEPWKPVSVGDSGQKSDETHWGAFTASRTPKFGLQCHRA